jgi:hypothetical protein
MMGQPDQDNRNNSGRTIRTGQLLQDSWPGQVVQDNWDRINHPGQASLDRTAKGNLARSGQRLLLQSLKLFNVFVNFVEYKTMLSFQKAESVNF